MKREKYISECCICHKIKRKEGFIYTNKTHMDAWGHYHDDLKDLRKEFNIIISHGFCPECHDHVMEEFEQSKAEGKSLSYIE
jgi:hypothetical protein